jgi:transcriptional regulator with XRE-family HTH domain
MTPQMLRLVRKQRKWTQVQAASRLGVSQPYLALLEKGKRKLTPALTQKAVTVFRTSPADLPYGEPSSNVDPQLLARRLSGLGYPGFAYLRAGKRANPAVVFLSALAQKDLEAGLAEALPWVLLHYGADMDATWLVQQARLRNLTNKVGFVVDLARRALERQGGTDSRHYAPLGRLREDLRQSRLDVEDTLCQSSLSQNEREWLRQARSADAEFWHLLTNWQPEHLQYAR